MRPWKFLKRTIPMWNQSREMAGFMSLSAMMVRLRLISELPKKQGGYYDGHKDKLVWEWLVTYKIGGYTEHFIKIRT